MMACPKCQILVMVRGSGLKCSWEPGREPLMNQASRMETAEVCSTRGLRQIAPWRDLDRCGCIFWVPRKFKESQGWRELGHQLVPLSSGSLLKTGKGNKDLTLTSPGSLSYKLAKWKKTATTELTKTQQTLQQARNNSLRTVLWYSQQLGPSAGKAHDGFIFFTPYDFSVTEFYLFCRADIHRNRDLATF